ncbi:MAG: choice-of-anchor tandem repeat GloVer-containing protein, partial [Nocardioides sp.]
MSTTLVAGQAHAGERDKPSAADGDYRALVMFDGKNGAFPRGGVTQTDNGQIYGTTSAGGAHKQGTIFRLDSDGRTFATMHSFAGQDGAEPYGTMLAHEGFLYGVTKQGGQRNLGTVFRIAESGKHEVLASFDGKNGASPYAGLVVGDDGLMYGTTTKGGDRNQGTIYRLGPNGVETLFSFSKDTGSHPKAPLYLARDGALYGTTPDGGPSGTGTVYRLGKDGKVTVSANFDKRTSGVSRAPLMQHSGGDDFYGSVFGTAHGDTPENSNGDNGAIFRMSPAGQVSVLNKMNGANGGRPLAGLIEGSDGLLYGTIRKWGPWKNRLGFGVIYSMTPAGTMNVLHVFDGNGGGHPEHAVIQGQDGALYGTFFEGGTHKQGGVFRLDVG